MSDGLKLSNVIGNQDLISILRRRRLPQSTIFTGKEGIGKKTVAVLLSALGNCCSPSSDDLCGVCSSCIKSRSGNHPDITLFEPETVYLKIDQMRHLAREALFQPFEGRYRFFIVDHAECMTTEAANSLLKTLEEPPPSSKIILITDALEQLLPTIRSRCQIFKFQPLNRQDIVDYLKKHQFEGNLELRASLSSGSLGTAISLDLETYLCERDQMLQLLEDWLVNRSFAEIFEACEGESLRKQLKNREKVKDYLNHLEGLLQDLYFYLVETPERVVNLDKTDSLIKMANGLNQKELRSFFKSIVHTKKDLSFNVNPLMCFETLWLESTKIG